MASVVCRSSTCTSSDAGRSSPLDDSERLRRPVLEGEAAAGAISSRRLSRSTPSHALLDDFSPGRGGAGEPLPVDVGGDDLAAALPQEQCSRLADAATGTRRNHAFWVLDIVHGYWTSFTAMGRALPFTRDGAGWDSSPTLLEPILRINRMSTSFLTKAPKP